MNRLCHLVVIVALSALASPRAQAEERTFSPGSLIIPMDLEYQSVGMEQAYGLLFQLLREGVPVSWVIDPAKTWHAGRRAMTPPIRVRGTAAKKARGSSVPIRRPVRTSSPQPRWYGTIAGQPSRVRQSPIMAIAAGRS